MSSILDEMPDPTYVPARISENPVWKIAFTLSEVANNKAPVGWSEYIPLAEKVIEEAKHAIQEPKDQRRD